MKMREGDIEGLVRIVFEGLKALDAVKGDGKKAELREAVNDAAVSLVIGVLTDLHRIADAQEILARQAVMSASTSPLLKTN